MIMIIIRNQDVQTSLEFRAMQGSSSRSQDHAAKNLALTTSPSSFFSSPSSCRLPLPNRRGTQRRGKLLDVPPRRKQCRRELERSIRCTLPPSGQGRNIATVGIVRRPGPRNELLPVWGRRIDESEAKGKKVTRIFPQTFPSQSPPASPLIQ